MTRAWKTAWAASMQGPYPFGNPALQPELRFALPDPARGAKDQTLRMVIKPDIWGVEVRLRFSNAFGTKTVRLDGVFVGLHRAGGELVPGTNRPVAFAGRPAVAIPPGECVWSDGVALPFAGEGKENTPSLLAGRDLAVSFHVPEESGPLTWHAKALVTSYLSGSGAGSFGGGDSALPFPYTTTSWFFLDAVDMLAPDRVGVLVAFGDSLTDGSGSTLNGADRWPDFLARRIHAEWGGGVSVVNAGIGGNSVTGPDAYPLDNPFVGGPSALDRLERDVLSLSGVRWVIWLEGINDFGWFDRSAGEVAEGIRRGVAIMRDRCPGVRVIGATVPSALGTGIGSHGGADQDARRRELNRFIAASGVFDACVDFAAASLDAATGGLREEFVPSSTDGDSGDKLHPNRAGYLNMVRSIDLADLFGSGRTGK